MRVAIVGSRHYPRLDLVKSCIHRLAEWGQNTGESVVIISGSQPSFGKTWHVDETAIDEGRRVGLATVVHPAEWDRIGRGAGLARNSLIVDDADAVVAFWGYVPGREPGVWSRGTADSIRKALLKGSLRKVYGPDGEPIEFDAVGELLRQTLGA